MNIQRTTVRRSNRTVAWGLLAASTLLVHSCTLAPTAFLIQGSTFTGNEVPTLVITAPNTNLTVDQGSNFVIRWSDSDRDDNARISFFLVNTATNLQILLIQDLEENDTTGPDQVTIGTTLVPIGTYNLFGVISDSVNEPVTSFAQTTVGTVTQRVVINIVAPGQGPTTRPPIVAVIEPAFNQSVAQDDILMVTIQPSTLAPNPNIPFDADSVTTLYLLLDTDLDPNNDDPANPDPSRIITLRTQTIQPGDSAAINFMVPIDLSVIPPRSNGEPYFIRATIDDLTNPRVHQYAVGTINVVRLASGTVDLFNIGRDISGVRFYGFNPGANLGSEIAFISDFDIDGVDDFVMVAQFGNSRGFGQVGEAYLVYGRQRQRFGGAISVNTIGTTVSGVLFEGPPVRDNLIPDSSARTDGITSVSFIRDITGDNRPEILFGLAHVHGAWDSMDYDPGDSDPPQTFCYADGVANNFTNPTGGNPVFDDTQFYAGGKAVLFHSSNRDNEGIINVERLESTAVALELVGMRAGAVLDSDGESRTGAVFARADTAADGIVVGTDPPTGLRLAGARVIAGAFDTILLNDPRFQGIAVRAREDLFGQRVASMGDLNQDQVDEILISAPTNERYLRDLDFPGAGFEVPNLTTTAYRGSIIVLPGGNYNVTLQRDNNDEALGTSQIPRVIHDVSGSCTDQANRSRAYVIPADSFQVFAEDVDDFLGDASSAGDFNQDGVDDILCGAPGNDRSAVLVDTGATYVLYGRTVPGDFLLRNADDRILRQPMLRIRGVKAGDRIGWKQVRGLDVNGDRIDDIFLSSPTTDFGGVRRATCGRDFSGDGVFNPVDDLRTADFNNCRQNFGNEVFTDDRCKAFDYNNDARIDAEDQITFNCLAAGGTACCANLVDNGFIGIVFGGVFLDGDRTISQIGTSDLPGVTFFGAAAGHRAGVDISSAGDFNQDGFGDILITVPGEVRLDSAGRERLGVVYLVFGGTHLTNKSFSLAQVGSVELPGIVFLSPYVTGRPNEAAPQKVAFIGDINADGFGDIAIGSPFADFIDLNFPQGPDATDASVGRRSNAGDIYVIYGNNFGSNRVNP